MGQVMHIITQVVKTNNCFNNYNYTYNPYKTITLRFAETKPSQDNNIALSSPRSGSGSVCLSVSHHVSRSSAVPLSGDHYWYPVTSTHTGWWRGV